MDGVDFRNAHANIPRNVVASSRVSRIIPFSEHEGGFFPTGGAACFSDCSKPTFDDAGVIKGDLSRLLEND
jgi:hypothetical protein